MHTFYTLAGIVLIALLVAMMVAACIPLRIYRYEFVGGYFDGHHETSTKWQDQIAKPVPRTRKRHLYKYSFCNNHETDGVIVVTMVYLCEQIREEG